MTHPLHHRAASSLGLRVFTLAYALYAGFNLFFIAERFELFLPGILILGLSMALIFTGSAYALLFIAVISMIESAIVFPTSSNHLFLAFFLHAGIAVTTVKALAESHPRRIDMNAALYERLAPFGRALLVALYFWGTFHKLNSEFLDTGLSYGSLLLHYFPGFPPALADNELLGLAAIYGTIFIEAALILLIFSKNKRHYTFALCAIFHLIISINLYRNYIPFSLLSISLYTFCLPPRAIARMCKKFPFFKKTPVVAGAILLVLIILSAGFMSIETNSVIYILRWLWIPVLLLIVAIVAAFFMAWRATPSRSGLVSPSPVLNVLAVMFLLNGASPYIGLKSGQSMEMFSNLRTENGHSNHIIITKPVYLFPYLDNTLHILTTTHPELVHFANRNYEINPFVLEYHMANRPHESITYKQNGRVYEYPQGITPDMARAWHKPLWLYKMLRFKAITIEGRAT